MTFIKWDIVERYSYRCIHNHFIEISCFECVAQQNVSESIENITQFDWRQTLLFIFQTGKVSFLNRSTQNHIFGRIDTVCEYSKDDLDFKINDN